MPFTDRQIEVLNEVMPQIVRALTVADDATRGYRRDESRAAGDRTIPMRDAEAIERLRALKLGALLDRLNDWCWCAEEHDGSCPTDNDAPLSASRCNLDVDGCSGGEDGQPCPACAADLTASEREARASWAAASPQERGPAKYERELRESGRTTADDFAPAHAVAQLLALVPGVH